MKKIYLLSLLFIIGCGTSNNKVEDVLVIPIDYENNEIIPFSESGLKLSYELIPLYADTASFHPPMSGYQVKIYRDNYYLFQTLGAKVRIFDKDGKFVKNLLNGKGPGELGALLSDICFHGDIFSIHQMGKISYFNLKGEHIRDVKRDGGFISVVDVCQFGDHLFSYSPNAFESNLVQVVNSNSGSIVTHAAKCSILETTHTEFMTDNMGNERKVQINRLPMPSSNNRFTECNENLYFNIPMSDCIFRVNKGDSIPYVYMKVGDLFTIENMESISTKELTDYPSKNKLFTALNSLHVRDDGNLISFDVPKNEKNAKSLHVIYDKRENKLYEFPITNFYGYYPSGDYSYYVMDPSYIEYIEEKSNGLEKEIMNAMEQGNEKIETYIIKVKISR